MPPHLLQCYAFNQFTLRSLCILVFIIVLLKISYLDLLIMATTQ